MRAFGAVLGLLSFASTVAAATCNKQIALPWPTSSGTGQCQGMTPEQCRAMLNIQEQGQCNAVGCDPGDLIRRQTFSCDSTQTCYLYTTGILLCLNVKTGDYVDQYGGKGNAIKGTYSGPATTLTGGSRTSTNTASASATRSASTTASSRSTASTATSAVVAAVSSTTATSTRTGSATASAVQSTQTGGAPAILESMESALGALAVVMAFAL